MTTSPNPNAGSPSPDPQPQDEGPLVDVRTAVIFLIGAFIGLVVGGLTYLDGHSTAMALLAGVSASGVSIPVLHKLIARR